MPSSHGWGVELKLNSVVSSRQRSRECAQWLYLHGSDKRDGYKLNKAKRRSKNFADKIMQLIGLFSRQ